MDRVRERARLRDHGGLVPTTHGSHSRRHHDRWFGRAIPSRRQAPDGGRTNGAAVGALPRRRYIRSNAMRFPVVLFDLDGTVIDSGAIILASMRHAAKEVLGAAPPDDELMAAVGGPGLEAQMHALAPDRVNELIDVYRAHNEPLHEGLVCCAGIDGVLVRLKEEGRRLGIVTAKRRQTVELAFAQVPLGHLFETIVGGDETELHKPDPAPLLLAAERLRVSPG